MSGSRLTRLMVIAVLLLVGLDLLLTGKLSPLFDVGFAALCIGAAFLVRPRDFFRAAMLPPFLLLGLSIVLAFLGRNLISQPGDGFIQAIVSGLAHHSGALFAGFVNALVVLGIRARMKALRVDKEARADSPYSKRSALPAPYLVSSGAPEEKSTTVVGSDEVSPQSRTASSF